MKEWLQETPEGVRLRVRVKPGSRKEGIEGVNEEACLVIRVRAPAVENQANQALVEFLAKKLRVARSRISLERGGHSRTKTLLIREGELVQIKRALVSDEE